MPAYDPARQATRVSGVAAWLAHPPRWLWRLIRNCWPIPRAFGWAAVSRYDDVVEVLSRSDVFRVPFGDEIARLNDGAAPGTPFILGIDDEAAHDRQLALVMQAFRREDAGNVVTPLARAFARKVIDAAQPPLDAIAELVTAVPLEICRGYYGVKLEEPQKFAYACIDVSGHLFGPPPIEPNERIDEAAAYVRAVLDRAIQAEHTRPQGNDTVLARLIEKHRQDPQGLPLAQVRSFLTGMIIGFVPTNTMAGGHILEVLLSRPAFLRVTQDAAAAGDDDLLRHCLFEAMRFLPLNPGPFRVCAREFTVAAGTARAARIRKGTRVLAATSSAMFDSRQLLRPREFDPHRPASDSMLFGYGMHWCVGFFIAQAQIAETFRALLQPGGLRRAAGPGGKLARRGLFPDHLFVEWGAGE